MTAGGRASLVRRRDVREGVRPLAVRVPGGGPSWPGAFDRPRSHRPVAALRDLVPGRLRGDRFSRTRPPRLLGALALVALLMAALLVAVSSAPPNRPRTTMRAAVAEGGSHIFLARAVSTGDGKSHDTDPEVRNVSTPAPVPIGGPPRPRRRPHRRFPSRARVEPLVQWRDRVRRHGRAAARRSGRASPPDPCPAARRGMSTREGCSRCARSRSASPTRITLRELDLRTPSGRVLPF